MFRGIIPFLLASLASTLFAWAINMPLFEWQVSEVITDPPYEIRFNPSPWIAKFGDSLEDRSVIFYQFDGSYCGDSFSPEKLNSVVRRSWSEESVEWITRNINHSIIPWLWTLIFLCGIYIGWYAFHYQRPITEALIFSVVAMILLCILLDVARPFFAKLGSLGCLEGTITFNARLAKVHFETLLVFFAAIIAEVVAVSMMLRQTIRAIMQRKESSKSAVG
jgi:hypothetical protein